MRWERAEKEERGMTGWKRWEQGLWKRDKREERNFKLMKRTFRSPKLYTSTNLDTFYFLPTHTLFCDRLTLHTSSSPFTLCECMCVYILYMENAHVFRLLWAPGVTVSIWPGSEFDNQFSKIDVYEPSAPSHLSNSHVFYPSSVPHLTSFCDAREDILWSFQQTLVESRHKNTVKCFWNLNVCGWSYRKSSRLMSEGKLRLEMHVIKKKIKKTGFFGFGAVNQKVILLNGNVLAAV